MAQHLVKCKYCSLTFDTNKEPFVQVSARRYAHESCHKKYLESMTQDQKDEEDFFKYTQSLFGEDYNYLMTKKLANQYVKENGYTYGGMLKSLKWFFEIQHNSIEKSNGSIGIIPYIYLKARDYYYSIWLAQQANKEKDIDTFIQTSKEITIESPRVYIKPHKMFDMGEDDE